MKAEHITIRPPRGMDQRYSPDPRAADLAVNLRWDPRGAWGVSRGLYPAIPDQQGGSNVFDTQSVGAIETITWFQQAPGRQFLVWEQVDSTGELDLVYLDGRQRGYLEIEAGRTYQDRPWERTHYCAAGDWLFVVNGIDAAKRWDGTRYYPVGFSRLPTPPKLVEPNQWVWGIQAGTPGREWVSGTPIQSRGRWDQVPLYFPPLSQGGLTFQPPMDQAVSPTMSYLENHAFQRGVGDAGTDADLSTDIRANEAEWMYGYAVSYISDNGNESPLSEPVWVGGLNFGRDLNAAGTSHSMGGKRYPYIDIEPAPDHVRAIRVWRTDNVYGVDGNSGRRLSFYLHSEHETGGRVAFADGRPDSELGDAWDDSTHGLWPTAARLPTLFKGTMFVAVGATVRYSAPVFLEQMPAGNVFALGDYDNGRVVALRATKNALVVFKERAIYLIKGDPASGFYSETLTEDDGAACSRTIEIPGVGLCFANSQGLKVLVGALENTGTPTDVRQLTSPMIDRFWSEEVQIGALAAAWPVHVRADHEVWWMIPTEGTHRPTKGVVYHYLTGELTIRDGYFVGCAVDTRDHRSIVYMGSHDTSHRGIFVYTDGAADLDGASLTGTWRSVHIGPQWERLMLVQGVNLLVAERVRDVTVNWRVDHAQEFALSTALSAGARDHDDAVADVPVWGAATTTWSATEKWWTPTPTTVDYDVHSPSDHVFPNGLVAQVEVASSRMLLQGVAVRVSQAPTDLERSSPWRGVNP